MNGSTGTTTTGTSTGTGTYMKVHQLRYRSFI